MKTFPQPLPAKEEQYYLQRLGEGDARARDILVEHNLRLVAHIVKKYQSPEEEMEDLISIGTIGLIKAITTFNSEKGPRLATYAARCVENELLMYFRAKKKTARETSYYEPIGTDKEGNEIHLLDIMESGERDAFSQVSLKADSKRLYELLGEVLTDSTKKNLQMRVDAECGACSGKMDIAKRAKELGLDAIHDTVHEMAKDEARHGRGMQGLLERYFG